MYMINGHNRLIYFCCVSTRVIGGAPKKPPLLYEMNAKEKGSSRHLLCFSSFVVLFIGYVEK